MSGDSKHLKAIDKDDDNNNNCHDVHYDNDNDNDDHSDDNERKKGEEGNVGDEGMRTGWRERRGKRRRKTNYGKTGRPTQVRIRGR